MEAEEVLIHTMPAEFRGGKSSMTPTTPAATPPTPTATPLSKVVPAETAKAPVKSKRMISPVLLMAGGIIFVAVIALAAYLLLTINPTSETVVAQPPELVEQQQQPVETEAPVVQAPIQGLDQDSDGLTNTEEILFGSDPRNPDTDDDTYLDGNEVYHLYNPRGSNNALLTDAGFAREFQAPELSYRIIFPSRWTVQSGNSSRQETMFRAPTGEQVRVYVLASAAAPDLSLPALSRLSTKQNYEAILSEDKFTTYIFIDESVYVVTYELKDVLTINFLTTYQMMVNSLLVAPYEPES